MTDNPDFIEVQKYLSGVDYPASRDDLIKAARDNGAGDAVVSLLEGIADREYDGPTGVSEAVAGND